MQRRRTWCAWCLPAAWVALCAAIGGCASGGASIDRTPGARVVVADWNDVDAAVETGTKGAQVAVVGVERSENQIIYKVVTHTDEPGSLTIEKLNTGGTDPQSIRLEADIGRFGDPRREGELVGHVAKRLARLSRREHAPLD